MSARRAVGEDGRAARQARERAAGVRRAAAGEVPDGQLRAARDYDRAGQP